MAQSATPALNGDLNGSVEGEEESWGGWRSGERSW